MKKMSLDKRVMAALPINVGLRAQYLLRMRKILDLNNPQSFNEKVQFRKAFDENPLLATCSDKVLAKRYVADRVGAEYIIPTLWFGKQLPEMSERCWPRPFVLKANHTSGSNIFIRPDDVVDWEAIEKTVSKWMKSRYRPDLFERHYDQIEPMLLVEPLIGEDYLLDDYKFMVFNGRVEFVTTYTGRGNDLRTLMLTRNWEPLGCRYYCDRPEVVPEKPACFDEMIEIAEQLGREFCFVRVDLYQYNDKPLFGEMTFTPGSGYRKFEPAEFDLEIGSFWDVSEIKRRKRS